MRFLIIWEEVPEYTRMYEYNTNNVDEIKKLHCCHNNFVNSTEMTPLQEEALEWLNTKLAGQDMKGNVVCEPLPSIYNSDSKNNDIPTLNAREGYSIIVTGFLM